MWKAHYERMQANLADLKKQLPPQYPFLHSVREAAKPSNIPVYIRGDEATPGEEAPPGLLRGLADAHVVSAMRQMHGQLARSWTVAQLAKTAGLSRSAFFERFQRTVAV